MFSLESEAALFERMRQEARERPVPERIDFPPEPLIASGNYSGRSYPPSTEIVEPAYQSYGRLYFEQKNFERYGWDLGPVSALISPGVFFADVVLLPYNFFKAPCERREVNTGYCLPGDPVPLMWYPPEWSLSGALGEASAVLLLLVAFP